MSETQQAGATPSDDHAKSAPADAPRAHAAVSWHAVIATYLPALVFALGAGVALPAVPTLAKTFAVDFGVASWVISAFLLGNLAGTIPSGWMIDRFGRRRVMIAGPLLAAATALLVPAAHTFAELLVLRFVGGFAAQMWLMCRIAAISHGAAPKDRGRLISWMFGMDNTGKLAGPLLGALIIGHWGVGAPFIAYGLLSLVALVPTFIYAEDTPRVVKAAARLADAGPAPSLRSIIAPRLVYFGVALFAGLTRGPVQADLLHLYAAFAYNLGPGGIGFLATGAALISWPIGFLAGWILDRFGRKRTMVPGFSGVAVAMALLAVSAFAHLSLGWYVALFFLGVSLQALTGGSVQTVGADVAPAEGRGTFLGLWRFTGQGGAAISPIIFALLADHASYGIAFLFVACCAASVAYLLIRHVPETGGRK